MHPPASGTGRGGDAYAEGEVIVLDLKGNQITLQELLRDPKAHALLQKRFGQWMKHPLFAAAQSLTLEQLLGMAQVYLPKTVVQGTLNDLRKL